MKNVLPPGIEQKCSLPKLRESITIVAVVPFWLFFVLGECARRLPRLQQSIVPIWATAPMF